ncbi:pyrroline-5-carboxylate reductase [Peribacillus deserti]|uniref:Pyrroline-5-carboxylate reductase n=1 Tax=Peribacillus deserti TaxID=673318 RepID=A0ABS2QLU2_9BACI|nr:pyrroline-5-carboxylate reductase [Peribacillus deserti]MBM7693206.1 pyrroline-5-carboxylate reductase [Peribacillus deserti]
MNKLAFIGGGSMAEAIISGITAKGILNPPHIYVINKSDRDRLEFLQKEFGITPARRMEELLTQADIAVLAVKPKDVISALSAAKDCITDNMLIISVAAGVSMACIEKIIGRKTAIIRAMPNTSAAIGKSATAIAVNELVSEQQLSAVMNIFQSIGLVAIVEEQQLDAVTGLSGSGPAYIYYLAEAMMKSAQEIGLEDHTAKELTIQTLIGAAEMLQTSSKSPQLLRKEVTSPGGTTEAGIKVLDQLGVYDAVISCIKEASRQSKELGENLSEQIHSQSARLD